MEVTLDIQYSNITLHEHCRVWQVSILMCHFSMSYWDFWRRGPEQKTSDKNLQPYQIYLFELFHADTVWLDCWPPVLHRLICCTSILYLSGMCIICHVHLNLQSSYVNRFRDNKATFGKLQFFSHLCKKLHQDMEEFAEILSPSRKGGLNYCIIWWYLHCLNNILYWFQTQFCMV